VNNFLFRIQGGFKMTANLEKEPTIDVEEVQHEVALKLENSHEVVALTRQIDMRDANTILTFGNETANEISQFADKILATMRTSTVEDSGDMLIQLNKIMDKFDIKDFEEKKPGFLEKLFNSAKNAIETLLQKYDTMGTEVNKVFQTLKSYEAEINKSNEVLEEMFERNMDYYELLEKYIYAGNQVIQEVKTNHLPMLEQKAQTSGQQLDQVNLNNAHQMLEMLEQRVYDLELAKNVSLQTMPQIKLIQKGNFNLVRKINSAFIITIPIFKQCLTQAITLKRQAIQAKAMSALDEKTNELLLRNAQNTALQSKLTAQLASNSSIDIETLEETWRTIVQGIEETKAIQDEAKQKRIDGTKRLQAIQDDFQNKTKLVR